MGGKLRKPLHVRFLALHVSFFVSVHFFVPLWFARMEEGKLCWNHRQLRFFSLSDFLPQPSEIDENSVTSDFFSFSALFTKVFLFFLCEPNIRKINTLVSHHFLCANQNKTIYFLEKFRKFKTYVSLHGIVFSYIKETNQTTPKEKNKENSHIA